MGSRTGENRPAEQPYYADPYTRIAWLQEEVEIQRAARVRAEEALRKVRWEVLSVFATSGAAVVPEENK